MDDIDDDFGDLYADVQIQATTAVNALPNFSAFYIEPDDVVLKDSVSVATELDSILQVHELKATSASVPNCQEDETMTADNNGSDSEDDLNILLNDDGEDSMVPNTRSVNFGLGGSNDNEGDDEGGDCGGGVPEGIGSGKSRNWVDQPQAVAGLERSSGGLGGGEKGNGGTKGSHHSQYSQFKYIRPPIAAVSNTSNANVSVAVASFSSTFHRGDWEDNGCSQQMESSSALTQSGYNFSLPRNRTILDVNIDMFERKPWRQPGADITAFFNFGFDEESWKHYCNCLEQSRQHAFMLSTKIPVSDPTKHSEPKGRLIQVEESICDRQPSFDISRRLERDSDVVIQIHLQDSAEVYSGSDEEIGYLDTVREATEHVDFGATVCSRETSSDKISGVSLEGKNEKSETSVPERCSRQTTPSNALCMDLDNHGTGQISDVDRHHDQTVGSSEGSVEAVETSNNINERAGENTCNTTASNVETELSVGEQSKQNLDLSCSGTHSEASHDCAYINPEKVYNHTRKPSLNSTSELQESVLYDHYHAKEAKWHDAISKCSDHKNYSRNRTPIRDDGRRYNRRFHRATELKRYYKDDKVPPFSGSEVLHDVDRSRVRHYRQRERLHNFNHYGKEHSSFHSASELSYDHNDEMSYDDQIQTTHSKNIRRKGFESYRAESDQYIYRKRYKREYSLEQRKVNGEVDDRDWYYQQKGLTVNDMDPFPEEPRRLVPKDSSYLEVERDCWLRRKELQFRKSFNNSLVAHNYRDCFIEERFDRSFLHDNLEVDCQDNKYERRLTCTRGFESFSRSERLCASPSIDLETLCDEDEYRYIEGHWHLPSRRYKDLPTVKGGRWCDTAPPCKDVYGVKTLQPDGRRRTQTHHEQLEVFHKTENGFPSRHWDAELSDRETSLTLRKTSRHKCLDAKRGTDNVLQEEWHRYNEIRERRSDGYNNRSANTTSRCYHDRTFTRCGDSIDSNLVVREGKSSGRWSTTGSLITYGRIENMDWDSDKKGIIGADYDEPYSKKAGYFDNQIVQSSQNNRKWHDKFPVTQDNEALDIEEGQIITEELNDNLKGKGCASEVLAKSSDVKERNMHNGSAAEGKKVVKECNHQRILDMLAKMEKRRERFKEPFTSNNEPDKISKPLVDEAVEKSETKPERPTRKRRWGGS